MRILIGNSRLQEWAGSEITCLDLAHCLRNLGHEPVLFGLITGAPFETEIKASGLTICTPQQPPQGQFDLFWLHHPFTLYWLGTQFDLNQASVIYASLSPTTPMESLPFWPQVVNLFLANSSETKEHWVRAGIEANDMRLFPNPVYGLENHKSSSSSALPTNRLNIAIVSNSLTPELEKLARIHDKEFTFELFGTFGRYELVTLQNLSSYDAVITIGRTVQSALCLGIPVYCYGHFGGPGFLNDSNFERAAWFNFSGRCSGGKLNAKQILTNLHKGFAKNRIWAEKFKCEALKRYRMEPVVSEILDEVNKKTKLSSYRSDVTALCAQRHAATWLDLTSHEKKLLKRAGMAERQLLRLNRHPIVGSLLRIWRWIKSDPNFGACHLSSKDKIIKKQCSKFSTGTIEKISALRNTRQK